MPTVGLSPLPKMRFEAVINGVYQPAVGYKLFTYITGTTTNKTSYTDSTGAVANPNPIILDSNGEANVWLDGIYRLELKTNTDVLVSSTDGVSTNDTLAALRVSDITGLLSGLGSFLGQVVEVASYHPNWSSTTRGPIGGGVFVWDPSKPKTNHNGGTIISPTVPWDGTQANLAAFLAGTGETTPAGNGCWIRNDTYSVDITWFGARGDGTTDDRGVFQKAIDYLVASGKSGELHVPAGTYRINTGLTIDVSVVTLNGNAALLDFTSLTSGAAITLTGASINYSGNPYYNGVNALRGFKIIGPGSGVATTIGIKFTGTGLLGSNDIAVRDCTISQFATGVVLGNVAYHLSIEHCSIFLCSVCVEGQLFSNAGARNVFTRCKFFNSDYAFDLKNASSGSTNITDCVIAGITLVSILISGGHLSVTNCDFESGGSQPANYRVLWVSNASFPSYSYINWHGNQVSVKNATNVPIYGIDGAAILTITGGYLFGNAACTGGVFGSTGTGAGTIATVNWAHDVGTNPMESYAGASLELYQHAAFTNAISANKTTVSFEAVSAMTGPVTSNSGVFFNETNTISLTLLNTLYSLGLGTAAGLLICRDGTSGGTAVFACDPSVGVVAMHNGIVGLAVSYSGGQLSMQVTSGAANRQIRWAIIKVQS